MREGADFAGHYKIIRFGCGTGCSANLMVDLRSGQVFTVPYGGEPQYMLDISYRLTSNALVAKWISGEFCLSQTSRWNGSAFTIADAPRPEPESVCRG